MTPYLTKIPENSEVFGFSFVFTAIDIRRDMGYNIACIRFVIYFIPLSHHKKQRLTELKVVGVYLHAKYPDRS